MPRTDDTVIAEVAGGFDALRKDVGKLVESLERLARSQIHTGLDIAADAPDRAGAKIADAFADAKDSARSASSGIEASVARNPVTALLVAFGVGLSLALVSRPRG